MEVSRTPEEAELLHRFDLFQRSPGEERGPAGLLIEVQDSADLAGFAAIGDLDPNQGRTLPGVGGTRTHHDHGNENGNEGTHQVSRPGDYTLAAKCR